MNKDSAAEAGTKPIKPEGSEDLHSDISHSDNEVQPEVDCENVGGLDDNEMEAGLCHRGRLSILFVNTHGKMQMKLCILLCKPKFLNRWSDEVEKVGTNNFWRDMADAYGKELFATKPLAFELCSSTCMQQFGLQFRQDSSKMITSQNSFIALQKRKLMDDDETSRNAVSVKNKSWTRNLIKIVLWRQSDLKAQGPAAVALDLLVRKKTNEEQCDATALIVETVAPTVWTKRK